MAGHSNIVATYLVDTAYPREALTALCRTQSVGHPTILTTYETRAFLAKWAAQGYASYVGESPYVMTVEFPERLFGTEGLNYVLSVVVGSHLPPGVLQGCRLLELSLGSQLRHLATPTCGVAGLRTRTQVPRRPLIGGWIRPKVGLSPPDLANVVSQLGDGGCDVILEDPLLADQSWCAMKTRLALVRTVLPERVLYIAAGTSNGSEGWKRARIAQDAGCGLGLSLWSSLGTLQDIGRHVDCPIFLHAGGEHVWTTGPFGMAPTVLRMLAHYAGCDSIPAGMFGGVYGEPLGELRDRIAAMRTSLPSFTGEMTSETASAIATQLGPDVLLLGGSWLYRHPHGLVEACKALRRAVEPSGSNTI